MRTKRLLMALIAMIAITSAAFAEIKSGSCGDKATYTFDTESGLLKIEGTGAMMDYTHYTYSDITNAPWYSYHSDIIKVEISDGITSIGDYAFYKCISLTSINIPNSVTEIGSGAFYSCTKLAYIIIGSSVNTIWYSAFTNCPALKKVFNGSKLNIVEGSSTNGGVAQNALVVVSGTISKVDDFLYYGNGSPILCHYLGKESTITLPDNIDNKMYKIESYTFLDCKELKNVTISHSVTSIGSHAFDGVSLESLTIGSNVTSISTTAFTTKPVKTIWLTSSMPNGYRYAEGQVNYVTNNDYYLTNAKTYKYLSSMFEQDGVKYAIISPAERTCDVIDCIYDIKQTDIEIPETVSYKGINMKVLSVNEYAFHGNDKIEKVEIANDGGVGKFAFQGCPGIKKLVASNNGSIGTNAFSGCSNLLNATISNNGSIGGSAFAGCANLKYLEINGSGDIDGSAFANCTGLLVARINKIGEIGSNAFSGCSSLEEVKIGDGVSTIASSAFSGCLTMNSLTLGSALKSIGSYAFKDCTKVVSLVCRAATPPTCGTLALEDISKWDCTLYVPAGSVAKYQTTSPWDTFFFINDLTGSLTYDEEDSIEETTAESSSTNTTIYDLQGRKVKNARNGLFIQNGRVVLMK